MGDREKYITVRVAWYLALPEHLPLWHIAQQQNFFCLSSFAFTFFICFSFHLSFIVDIEEKQVIASDLPPQEPKRRLCK